MADFDKVIPPGQEGKVVLKLEGDKVHGSFNKGATVFSNDPKHPRMKLTMMGTIIKYIDVLPNDKVYLSGFYGEPVTRELVINSNEKNLELKIYKVKSNIDDKITYKVLPGGKKGQYKLKIWKNPKLPAMSTWGSLTLYTNSKNVPEKLIQVSVTTRNSIQAQPSIINFGRVSISDVSGGSPGEEKSLVLTKTSGEFHIKKIDFTSDYYKATYKTMKEGRKYAITVRFTPGKERRKYSDQMIIRTDDPREPTVKVRLVARSI